jgi:hypothetical protein
MKVKVVKDVALLHGGQPFTEGDVVELPDRVGADWVRLGWASEAKPAAPRKRSG